MATSSPRATIAHLRVNKYSQWTKKLGFLPYMGHVTHIYTIYWSCDLETLLTSAEELLSGNNSANRFT